MKRNNSHLWRFRMLRETITTMGKCGEIKKKVFPRQSSQSDNRFIKGHVKVHPDMLKPIDNSDQEIAWMIQAEREAYGFSIKNRI